MRKPSTWVTTGSEPAIEIHLVNHRGVTLSRLPRRYETLGEAQAEAARRNEKAKR